MSFFVRYECFKDVFCTLWMSLRRLLYVMDVLKTSTKRIFHFLCYECVKDVFKSYLGNLLNISKRRL